MISYRGLRYIASFSVGVIAMIGVFAFLWAYTAASLPAILFWSLIAYAVGIGAVWEMSAPQKKKRGSVPIVNLRKEEWK